MRIGFLPTSDCAPLVYAREAGLFAQYGLEVELSRETSASDIRDKVIQGRLDGAQAPATLPFIANLQRDSDECACVSGLVLSLEGNALTLSCRLWEQGIQSAADLQTHLHRQWGKRTFAFGVTAPFSTQSFLLQKWLRSAGINPATVRTVVVPPAQLFPTLRLGYIDGFCASEPWNSLAIQAGAGACVATSAELAPLHPDKVLMVRQSFAAGRTEQHLRLLAALIEACAFCDRPENRRALAEVLSQAQYVDAPPDCFAAAAEQARLGELSIFYRNGANEPSDERASWLITHLYEVLEQNAPIRHALRRAPILSNVFVRETFHRARELACNSASRRDAEVIDRGR